MSEIVSNRDLGDEEDEPFRYVGAATEALALLFGGPIKDEVSGDGPYLHRLASCQDVHQDVAE